MVNSPTRETRAKSRAENAGWRWPFSHRRQETEGPMEEDKHKKMLIYDIRSRKVYENNKNTGIMSVEKSDIYVNPVSVLKIPPDFGGHFCRNNPPSQRLSCADWGCPARGTTPNLNPSVRMQRKRAESSSSRSRRALCCPFVPRISEPRVPNPVFNVRCYTSRLPKCPSQLRTSWLLY